MLSPSHSPIPLPVLLSSAGTKGVLGAGEMARRRMLPAAMAAAGIRIQDCPHQF